MKPKLVIAGNMDAFNKKFPHEYAYKAYPISKGKPKKMEHKLIKKKYTLNQLGTTVDKLGERMDKMDYTLNQLGTTVDKLGERMDKMDYTLNQIGNALKELTQFTKDGFKRIEARLDYNNLKKLPDNYRVEG